ncbi:MAG: YceI family protein [Candidatus Kapabacteria bacterium]|nr:YceI family protein [Ignavibacteriota bacterium]MCW5885638.1 YceI family protein [Candidatus Kapabacteria bacterium]
MLKFFMTVALALAFFGSAVLAQDYAVDSKASNLKWTGEKVLGKHWGTVQIKTGEMKKTGSNFTGTFTIDMTTIKVDDLKDEATNAKLLGHLKSDDFFSVDKHNTSTFKLKSIKDYTPKKDEKGKHWVTGELTIKGITHEIGFPAEINFDGNGFKANANFTINRAKWDIRYGSGSFFDNLGDKAISDDIKFELSLAGKIKQM